MPRHGAGSGSIQQFVSAFDNFSVTFHAASVVPGLSMMARWILAGLLLGIVAWSVPRIAPAAWIA